MCYNNMRCRVRVGGELTDAFLVSGGLKQGCPLSTLLFNLALEWIMRQTPTATAVNLGEDFQGLQHMIGAFREASS